MIQSQELKRRHLALVVEDVEINRELLCSILEDNGYDTISAENGLEGMKAVREYQEKLSIILLDLMMPVMDGFEVLKELKEDKDLKEIPVIVLTAEKSAELKALEAGAVDFIAKPYDNHEIILARVARIIELSEGRQLIRAAELDPLTKLYTRGFFYEYTEQVHRSNPNWPMDAMALDIEQFHSINGLHGRRFGDIVLRQLADGIREFLSETKGLASRLEADRFLIVCQHRPDGDYQEILQRLQQKLNELSDHASVRLRMGVRPWQEGLDPATMFDQAKTACDMVRGDYISPLRVFDQEIHEKELFQQRLLGELQAAIDEEQFIVYYQPKYDIQCDPPRLASAEALVRWEHPEMGLISPGEFIPLFENNGLIYLVDQFVWNKAAGQIAAWRDKLDFVLPISVNLSRTDFFEQKLESNLARLLQENRLSTRDLKLEVTESAYIDNARELISIIERLQVTGFEIEMDDFGSGYSSLNTLSSLPVDVLKMDMKFIQNVHEDSREFRMVELILDIARFLQVPVVAEGVETREQVDMLKEAGCELVQGFYFSRPVPAEEFERLIKKEMSIKRG